MDYKKLHNAVILRSEATKNLAEVVLMKDKNGNVIGFEKLNYNLPQASRLNVAFETIAA